MKRSPMGTMRRTVRRTMTWRPKQDGDQQLDIERLISPLRYDVLVRAQFLQFVSARPADEDPEVLVRAALDHPYRVWFEKVAMARFRPWVLADPALLRSQYAERVTTARELWWSFQGRGFDSRYPVTLRTTTGPRTSDSGATITRRIHVGDGGHRLAMLLAGGHRLEPPMYRLDPRPMPVIDNTATLAPALGLSAEDYLRFVSRGYAQREFTDLQALREHVAEHAADQLPELDSVLRAHGHVTVGTA